jgi:sporulation protein YlmC with PRC-barrel domain
MEQSRWLLAPVLGLSMALTLALAAPGHAAPAAAARANEPQASRQLVRSAELIGTQVRNHAGEQLGSIRDIVVDARQHRALYAVIGFGGVLGLGGNLFAYPLEVLQPAPAGDAVILDVPRAQLEQAPGYDHAQVPDWNDYLARVDRYWGTARGAGWPGWSGWTGSAPRTGAPPGQTHGPGAAPADRTTPGTVTPPAAAAGPRAAPGISVAPMPQEVRQLQAVRVTDLTGRNLREPRTGERIGRINEVVLDIGTGNVEFAVAAFDQGWFQPDRLVAIPMDAVRRDERFPRELVLEMTQQQVAQAPSFRPDRWPQFDEADFRRGWDRLLSDVRADRASTTEPAAGTTSAPATGVNAPATGATSAPASGAPSAAMPPAPAPRRP